MKIAFYCPNKPLDHPNPSGDLIIARSIQTALELEGFECREIVRYRSRWFWQSPRGWLGMAKSLAAAWRSALAFKPQLWLTYHTYYKSPDIIGPWVSSRLTIPYILFQPMYATKRRKRPGARTGFYLNRLAIKSASHAFINNEADMEALERILPSRRISYLPPGIYPEHFERDEEWGRRIREAYAISPDVVLLMTAARFRADVKFESMVYLFRALALMRVEGRAMPGFMLMAVGDGPREDELHRLAAELLPGRVVFTGRIRREEMARYYSAADIFVFPGIGESLGMVYLEAQCCGLPVVALDTGGAPQVVCGEDKAPYGQTGVLAAWDDGKAMAEAVESLVVNPELRATLGRNGARYVREARNLHLNYGQLSSLLRALAGMRNEE